MAMLGTLTTAFAAERRIAKPKRRRTPLLARAGRLAARVLPTWQSTRTFILHVAGFGCLSYAAWQVSMAFGLAAAGVSLLILEWLTGSDR